MKNIILFGVPRAGKSTFAKMILSAYPNYNLIQEDILSSSYIDTFNHINTLRKIRPSDMNFVYYMIKKMFDYSILYEPKLNFVLDTISVEFEDLSSYVDNDVIVLVFGYPRLTIDDAMDNVSKYDTKDDWTFIEPRWRVRNFFEIYIEKSQEYLEMCKKLNIKFVDTSYNREEVLDSLFEWLKSEIG
jgi:hypothetical protein